MSAHHLCFKTQWRRKQQCCSLMLKLECGGGGEKMRESLAYPPAPTLSCPHSGSAHLCCLSKQTRFPVTPRGQPVHIPLQPAASGHYCLSARTIYTFGDPKYSEFSKPTCFFLEAPGECQVIQRWGRPPHRDMFSPSYGGSGHESTDRLTSIKIPAPPHLLCVFGELISPL